MPMALQGTVAERALLQLYYRVCGMGKKEKDASAARWSRTQDRLEFERKLEEAVRWSKKADWPQS